MTPITATPEPGLICIQRKKGEPSGQLLLWHPPISLPTLSPPSSTVRGVTGADNPSRHQLISFIGDGRCLGPLLGWGPSSSGVWEAEMLTRRRDTVTPAQGSWPSAETVFLTRYLICSSRFTKMQSHLTTLAPASMRPARYVTACWWGGWQWRRGRGKRRRRRRRECERKKDGKRERKRKRGGERSYGDKRKQPALVNMDRRQECSVLQTSRPQLLT